jgi:DNA-binding NarL/FixJ family response regulator
MCKRDPIDALPEMLGLVLSGDLTVRSPMGVMSCDVATTALRCNGQSDRATALLGKLSVKEAEVVRLLTLGHSLQEVARYVNRSAKTISNQKRSAMHKLGLSNDMALARFVLQMDLG